MDRIDVYEYDRKNRDKIVNKIEEDNAQIVSWSYFAKDQKEFPFPEGTTAVYIDISSLFFSEDRADSLVAPVELIFNILQKPQKMTIYVIIEKQYSATLSELLYFKVGKIFRLETELAIEKDPPTSIVDIDEEKFNEVIAY